MRENPINEALTAIADGTPVVWADVERAPGICRGEFESLHLLNDVARAFRAGDAVAATPRAVQFRWGPLDVAQRIGAGHQGEVWRAFDPWLGREVALKLQHAVGDAATRRADPLDEARRLARIRHPNVLSCYGCAVHGGRAGLWSELIEGRSLADVLADEGALSIEESLRIGRDLARALAAVHATGLVHGDVKAGNVMRESGGRVVLMDFGAGGEERLLAARRLIAGTPAYLAPEVLDGAPASARSDLYALGVLLFVLLTRRMPFAGDDIVALRAAQRDGLRMRLAALRPDLDARSAAAIERCLDADPARRPHDAAELAACLEPGARESPAHRARRARWPIYAIAGALALSIAAFVLWPRAPASAWSTDAAFVRARGNDVHTLAGDAQVAAGDRLRLRLRSDRAAFVYVLNEDADGAATVLYPLRAGTHEAVAAGRETMLPGGAADAALAWEVAGDSAREEFLVVVALVPIASLETAIANWRRAAAPERAGATRSLGRVVADGDGPVLRGEHLRALLAALPRDDSGVRVSRYVFTRVP